MPHEITIEIDEDGKVALDIHGVVGPGCTDIVKVFERALGKATTTRRKGEFYQVAREERKVGR